MDSVTIVILVLWLIQALYIRLYKRSIFTIGRYLVIAVVIVLWSIYVKWLGIPLLVVSAILPIRKTFYMIMPYKPVIYPGVSDLGRGYKMEAGNISSKVVSFGVRMITCNVYFEETGTPSGTVNFYVPVDENKFVLQQAGEFYSIFALKRRGLLLQKMWEEELPYPGNESIGY